MTCTWWGKWICGDYASVEKDILDPDYGGQNYDLKFIESDIYGQYKELNRFLSEPEEDFEMPDNWSSSEDQDDFNSFYDPQQPIVKEKKVGRNDPCPCGSGKKYKKCCM